MRMTRLTAVTTPMFSLALCSLLWLSSLAPALAATVTDTFSLKLTGTERCRNNPNFVEPFNVKFKDGATLALTRDDTGVLTNVQATIGNSGNATLAAIALTGRAFPKNAAGLKAELVLSGRDPGHPDRFLTLRGTATFNQAGTTLTSVTGTFIFHILDDLNGAPNIDCLGSGTFATGAKPGLPLWAKAKLEAYVKASNTDPSDNFGATIGSEADIMHSVALDGDTLVVGAALEDSNATGTTGTQVEQDNNSATNSGAVYVFTRDTNGVWSQQAYLKASNTTAHNLGDRFGSSVALSGDTLAVGAFLEWSDATGVNEDDTNAGAAFSGAVYVFTRDINGDWSQQAYLKASNTEAGDHFGTSVALSGDTLAVGAKQEDSNATGTTGTQVEQDNNSAANSGAVYVFTRTGNDWSQQAYVKASNTEAGDKFGFSVALAGDSLAVGAYLEDSAATGIGGDETNNSGLNRGAVYVFTRNPATGVWSQQAYVKASNTGAQTSFGYSVALAGDTLAVGASYEDSPESSGAVYVFTRNSNGIWKQQAHVKASNTGAFDHFGTSVALSGDTLAVGAFAESSNAHLVNGDQTNNTFSESGAVYVFTRKNGVWSQQAYVKASNTGTGDRFGGSVALAGDTLAVGAERESSDAKGVDPGSIIGDQTNNSATWSGAVYVYRAP